MQTSTFLYFAIFISFVNCEVPVNPPSAGTCTNGPECCDNSTSIYSEKSKSCVGLSGKPCLNELCIDHATCEDLCDNADPITHEKLDKEICWTQCICPTHRGYTETVEGRCQANIGTACNSSSVCISNSECIEGVCSCGSDTHTVIWDSARELCVGLTGKPCIDDLHCVQNSQCFYLCDNFDPKTNTSTEEDVCFNNCLCPGEALANPPIEVRKNKELGRCQALFDGPCGNSNLNCIKGLVCIEGQCKCPFGEDHQYYDNVTSTCISLARGPCDLSSKGPLGRASCTPNAYCKNVTNVGRCTCESDFTEGRDGKCYRSLDFGEGCPKRDSVCNPKANLSCIDGKCACGNGLLKYDESTKACRGLVGSRCEVGSGMGLISCVDGVQCKVDSVAGRRPQLQNTCSNA